MSFPLLALVDGERHGPLWSMLRPRLASVCDIVELARAPRPGLCAVLATGGLAPAGYRLATDLPDATRAVLIDPGPPNGPASADQALSVIGFAAEPLLAWRGLVGPAFELRLLPSAPPAQIVDLLTDHVLDALGLVPIRIGEPMSTPLTLPGRFESVLRRQCQFLDQNEPLDPNARLDTLGLDSFGVVNLVVDIEDEFGVVLPEELMTEDVFTTPTTLWAAVADIVRPTS
ncbi:acyl carrier protein [Micromonospora sp. LOL_024]|uniref:acyl carrier protein n=1 Tax=Micromonospora sp. LOL_024 TaxID=3345412 RepID=UPI003A839493